MRSIHTYTLVIFLTAASVAPSFGAPPGTLQVGAAKVDITPAPDAALMLGGYAGRKHGFDKIHDHIYVRAIVLSDGSNQAVLLAWELGTMPSKVWDGLSHRVTRELGIPRDNLILAAVHDHSAPTLASGGPYSATPNPGNPAGGPPPPAAVAYTSKVQADAVEAIRRARANLQPAQFGFGAGKAYVNINRREFNPHTGLYGLGFNPEGPSDKTVAVLKFTDLSGKLIALFINYPVHAVVMGPDNYALTGDLAGATSRYVEQYYQGKIPTRSDAGWDLRLKPDEQSGGEGPVAVWTSGPAGDQNPVSADRDEDFNMVDAIGKILGEESVRVANNIAVMSPQVRILSTQKVISCPGRTLEKGLPRGEFKWDDAAPVEIRLTALRLNDVVLAGVSGEVFTRIYQRLKRESPFNTTVMVTHANGYSGYIPNDDAFAQVSYEVTSTHLKPGCAESGIVNGLLGLMGSQ